MNEELKIIIRAEIDNLRRELSSARSEIKGFSDEAQTAMDMAGAAVSQVGNIAKSGLQLIIGSAVAAAGALLATAAATKEYRADMAKLDAAFKTSGASAKTAKQTYNDLYRVLGDSGQAVEAAQHLAKITTNQKDLAQYTKICQGVYATFGDSLPIESLTEAINHSANLGEVQGTLADALEWSGVNVDEFNEQLFWCNSESEREKLIRDTLNGLYSEAAENYETTGKAVLEQNEAQARFTESMAVMGETIAPIMTLITNLGADIMEKLAPAIAEFTEKYMPEITKALAVVADAIIAVTTWILENWRIVSIVLGAITAVLAVLTVIVPIIMTVIGAISLAATIATTFAISMGAALLAVGAAVAGLGAFVVAIGAVVAGFIAGMVYRDKLMALLKSGVDAVLGWFAGLWASIKSGAAACWEWVKSVWSAMGSWFSNTVIQPVVKVFAQGWEKLKTGAAAAWNGVKSVFSSVASFFGTVFSNAWAAVVKVFSTGGKIFNNIKEGISSVFKTVVNSLIGGINNVIAVPFKKINDILSTIRSINILGAKPFSGIGSISVPQLPKLERGGVLEKGQIGLLEGNGAEAVVPLEKNTEWLDKLATMLSDKMGGNSGTNVVLEVDGTVLAQTSIKSINQLTRQTGKLGLVIM